ncbi:ABC transporter permease [Alteribacter keqinensis]|uniref:ABC transporter permease n=1 Tax=Alteribacter keqinensis TaxID=2483800 RepID=A0A3M7TUK6_9BACI|nr:ABC transporter permease [Alteribacter keqinensis]RNA68692.1 ABC transporter permease [Alteribacter keqinensis]
MNKFFIILFHTFFSKLKSKSFIISTIITAVIVAGIANIDRIFEAFEDRGGETEVVGVYDEEDEYISLLQEHLEPFSDQVMLTPLTGSEQDGMERLDNGEIDGLLSLTTGSDEMPDAVYRAKTVVNERAPQIIEQALQQVKVEVATARLGLDESTVEGIYAPVSFQTEATSDTARSEEELTQTRFLVNALVVVIYFSVLAYGNMIAMEVATEKSSRVMEILVSSVSPVKQMFAKIFGIGLLGIVQYMLIILIGYLSMRGSMESDGMIGDMFSGVPVVLMLYALVFFLLGYLFYATISAVLGSLVSRTEEVNIVITPLTLIVVVAFLISMFGLNAPESAIITVTSYIPFFTPMVMFLRVGMLQLPFWEIALGITVMVASIVLFAIIGARIYKGGVLMYGKVSSLKDIKQALALSKKES